MDSVVHAHNGIAPALPSCCYSWLSLESGRDGHKALAVVKARSCTPAHVVLLLLILDSVGGTWFEV